MRKSSISFTNRKPSVSSREIGGRSTVRKSRFLYWGRVRASLEPKKLNTSHAKYKSSFNFLILLCVFEGRCHQVQYFTRKNAPRQRHGLAAPFKGPSQHRENPKCKHCLGKESFLTNSREQRSRCNSAAKMIVRTSRNFISIT